MAAISAKCVSESKEKVLWDWIKNPVKTVYGLMTSSMGQSDFVELFQYCYPNLWQESAAVITERINSSQSVLYVHTGSSLSSKWTPWELGYAYAKGKKVCVLDLTDRTDSPCNRPIGKETRHKGVD